MKNGKLKRAKADFYMDSQVGLQKGGVSGAVIVPHSAKDSYLYELISLGAGHEDLMPPKNGPLKSEQLKLIGDWIDEGAEFGSWLGNQEAQLKSSQHTTRLSSFQKNFQNSFSNCESIVSSRLEAMVNEPFLLEAMTSENRLFSLSFRGYAQGSLKSLELWESDPQHIFRLDLSGHDLTPLKWFGFDQLYELNLSHTTLSGHLAETISRMTSLKKLNLYACSWPLNHFKALVGMEQLEVLVLSESNLTLAQRHVLRTTLSRSEVIF
jgi:hypothetical protein